MLGLLKSWIFSISSLRSKILRKSNKKSEFITPLLNEEGNKPKYFYKNKKNTMHNTLSVCMTIKNESSVIEKTLDSLLGLADEIVIVDTGSTDDTLDKINAWKIKNDMRDYMEIISAGNKYHDSNGNFNFSNGKNASILEATCHYIMWIDGSDQVIDPKKLRDVFEKACNITEDFCISMPTRLGELTWNRHRIFKNGGALFVGSVHEHLKFSYKFKHIITNVEILHQDKGDRQGSVIRNIKILLSEWEKTKDSRTAFYLANSYFDMGNYTSAYPMYKARIFNYDQKDFAQETFKAYEYACECIFKLKDRTLLDDFDAYTEDMMDFYPDRKEGYYYRAMYYTVLGKTESANTLYRKVLSIKTPHDGILWPNPNIYNDDFLNKSIRQL